MFRFSAYARRRKEGFSDRAAKILAAGKYWGDTVVYVAVRVFLVAFSLYTAAEIIEAGHQAAAGQAVAHTQRTVDRLEKLVVTCLSGGAFSVDGTAFLCKAESPGIKL